MRSRSGSCGLLARLLAGAAAVALIAAPVGASQSSAAGPLGLEIVSGPSGTVAERTATFAFRANGDVLFFCSLDGARPPTSCDSGTATYTDLADGKHSFLVFAELATDDVVTDRAVRAWVVAVPPDTRIDGGPSGTVRSTTAVFTFSAVPEATSFECSLDSPDFTPCASPLAFDDLARTTHTFEVRAVTEVGADPTPATVTWQIERVVAAAPDTRIVNAPTGTMTSRTATFAFVSVPAGAAFECSVDGRRFGPCTSPFQTEALGLGVHRFSVRAVTPGAPDQTPALAGWTIIAQKHPPDAGAGGGIDWTLPAVITVVALLGAVALSVTARLRLRARRLEWQLEARDEEPHGPCRAGRYIQKELTLKPSRRTIAHLDLEARDEDGARLERRLEGSPVEAINTAVRRYRSDRRVSPELKLSLLPAATALAAELESWLTREAEARRDVAVRAHLTGGKAESVFTPWRCVRGEWRKGRSWKVELEDERDQPVAAASHPYPVAVVTEVLLAQLASFVAEVDVVQTQRAPEQAPILHG